MNIIHGDCLEELKKLEDNSIDAVVCDPPYGLSNTKPQQVADVLKAWVTGDTVSVPAKRGGFMGKDWDSFVPPPAVWEECMRVLKPGGHMAVFAGARTQDLMGLSIRLAGFEIRDTLGWVYGSGMPKSHNISKAIDKRREERHEEALKVTRVIAESAKELGISRRDINLKINDADNSGGSAQSWTTTSSTGAHKPRVPEWDQWVRLRELLNLNDSVLDAEVWRLNGRKGTPGEAWEKREVIGRSSSGIGTAFGDGQWAQGKAEEFDLTAPATDAAKQWDGWGTSLKPAIEPILLCRKPLDGTVANNVLAHGVGGLNIDACRVSHNEPEDHTKRVSPKLSGVYGDGTARAESDSLRSPAPAGRFPANVLLDEHAAKEMDEQSGVRPGFAGGGATPGEVDNDVYGRGWRRSENPQYYADSGGASRFFPVFKYQAKAPKRERPVIEREDGTKIQHPTVKPLTLLEWLVELITPPGGVVLDPFAGSGTTLQAALNKGFQPIGIEQDADYIKLIEQRLAA